MFAFLRWDLEAAGPGSAASFGSFIAAAGMFDAAAFGVSSSEAALMDPQQRLLLECAGQVLVTAIGRSEGPTI